LGSHSVTCHPTQVNALVTYKTVYLTITHRSTNWAWNQLTSLMQPTTLSTMPNHHLD